MSIQQTPVEQLEAQLPLEEAARIAANREKARNFFRRPTTSDANASSEAVPVPDVHDPEYLQAFRNAETIAIPPVAADAQPYTGADALVAETWVANNSTWGEAQADVRDRLSVRGYFRRAVGGVALQLAGFAAVNSSYGDNAGVKAVGLSAVMTGAGYVGKKGWDHISAKYRAASQEPR